MAILDALKCLELEVDEREELIEILLAAVSQLDPSLIHNNPEQIRLLNNLSLTLESVQRESNSNIKLVYSRGALPFLDRLNLDQLISEAVEQRRYAEQLSGHYIARGGKAAEAILQLPALSNEIKNRLQLDIQLQPSECFFHYYETPQAYAELHIDEEDFAYNVLILLRHNWNTTPASYLYLVEPGKLPQGLDLDIGEAFIFPSRYLLHSRSAPGKNEAITTLSFGFRGIID